MDKKVAGSKRKREKPAEVDDTRQKRGKHDARKFFELREKRKGTICFGCRKKGHSLRV